MTDNYPYRTVQDCITLNAIRHMKRAGMHAAHGDFDYADGSAEKASRNFKRAALFDWKGWLASPVPWSK
jgi:hypothetical protein